MNLFDLARCVRFTFRRARSVITGLYVPLSPDGAVVVDKLPLQHVDRVDMVGGTTIPVGIGDSYDVPGFGWLRIATVAYRDVGTPLETIVRSWVPVQGTRLINIVHSTDRWTLLGVDRAELRFGDVHKWNVYPRSLSLQIEATPPANAEDASLDWTLIGIRIEDPTGAVVGFRPAMMPSFSIYKQRLGGELLRGMVIPPSCALVAMFRFDDHSPREHHKITMTGFMQAIGTEPEAQDRLRLTETPETTP